MKIFISLLTLIVSTVSLAATDNTVSVNADFADKSESTTISLQPSFKNLGSDFDLDLSIDATRNQNQANYNSAVEDFNIKKTSASAGFDLTWNHLITIGADGSNENTNDGDVKGTGLASRIRLKIHDLVLRAGLSDLYVRQKNNFYVLNTDIKDKLTVRNSRQNFGLSYFGLDSFTFSIGYSQYKYDTDVASFNNILSAKAILNRNGASFLSEVYSLIDHETSLSFDYSLNDNLDLELKFGESIDYLDPYTKSNDLRIGTTYYFKVFDVGGGVTVVKPSDSDDSLYSGDFTASYNF